MKISNIIIYLVLSFLLPIGVNAQIDTKIKKIALTSDESKLLNNHLRNYQAFSMDVESVKTKIKKDYKCEFLFELDEINNWEFDLLLNDLRGQNYKAAYTTDSGRFEYKKYVPNTFKGYTNKGDIARFNIDDESFHGAIFEGNSIKIVQEAKQFDKKFSRGLYLIYDLTDLISQEYSLLGEDFIIAESQKTIESISLPKGTHCSYYLQILADSDYELYQELNYSISEVYNKIFSILNVVEGYYEETFELRFVVSYQNVWTTSLDPYSSLLGSVILTEIRDEWAGVPFSVIPRDIVHLFTAKSGLDVGGMAYLGTLGTTQSVGFSSYVNSYIDATIATTAHEIGHNLNAPHPPSNICSNGDYIMCQGVIGSSEFYASTQNIINSFLNNNQYTLNNPVDDNLSLSGTVSGFNEFQASNSIISTQTISSGFTIYKTEEVILNVGFEVYSGSIFEIIIQDSGCD
ncbi:MAG: M12 family metallo-peptidase [Candidatus Paceibacterota bacterium]